MPRIHTITTDTVISDNDLILGTDGAQGANNATKNFSFGVFKNYLWTNVTFTGNLNVSGGHIILDNNKFLQSKLANGTVIDLIGINASDVLKIAQDNQAVTFGQGTVTLGGALSVGNNPVTLGGTLGVTGTVTGGGFTTAGTMSVGGNTNFDAHVTLGNASSDVITVSGSPTFNAPITVGSNGTGHAITIHSNSTGRALTYDPTNDTDGFSKLIFGENMKAQFGTNTSDLAIYNDSTESFIDAGTTAGSLIIRNRGDQRDIIFQAEDGEGGTSPSYEEYFRLDGSLSEAGTAGVNYTRWPDKANVAFGDVIGGELHGAEMTVYNKHFNISHMVAPAQTEKNINISNYSNDGDIKIQTDNGTGGLASYIIADGGTGAVELYWFGNKKLHTTTSGIEVTGSISMNGAYTLAAADGSANQVLTTNGNGTTSWQDASGLSQFVVEGNEFTNSLILGHATTGTLDAALGNTGVGVGAMNAITSGDHNAALGHDALGAITIGSSNVAIGKQALFTSVVDSNNVAIGKDALYSLTNSNTSSPVSGEAQNNVAIGWQAGNSITTGTNNIVIGYNADASSATANNEITIGNTSHTLLRIPGLGTTNDNVLKYSSASGGWIAGPSPASGVPFKLGGTGFGGTTNPSLLIGHSSTGDISSNGSSDGFANVGVGHGALEDIITGVNNTAIGFDAGAKLTNADSNTFLGAHAGNQIINMKYNVLIGNEAGRFIDTGDAASPSANVNAHNVGIGYQALKATSTARMTGTNNVAIGSGAMDAPTAATGNVAIGKDAGENLLDGNFNVMIGYQSGDGGGGEGDQNILVGANTDLTSSSSSGNIMIGYNINTGASNYTQIGNNSTKHAIVKGLRKEVSNISENAQASRNHIHVLDAAGNLTVTLPDSGTDSSVIGMSFTFVTKTAPSTGNVHKIVCSDTTNESIFGSMLATKASSAGSDFMQTDDAAIADGRSSINFNGTTQGGRQGTHITLTCIAADTWLVEGTMRYTGTFASSFANS